MGHRNRSVHSMNASPVLYFLCHRCPLIRGNAVKDSMAMNQAFSKSRESGSDRRFWNKKANQLPRIGVRSHDASIIKRDQCNHCATGWLASCPGKNVISEAQGQPLLWAGGTLGSDYSQMRDVRIVELMHSSFSAAHMVTLYIGSL